MSNQSLVQISLFDRGSAVKQQIADAIRVRTSFKKKSTGKGKNKKTEFVLNTKGEKIESAHQVYLPPRKSAKTEDLSEITGLEGQALMLFEQEARQAMMEAAFSHMAKLVASGNYTFKNSRSTTRGDFNLGLKLIAGRTRILTEEEFLKQAAQMGFEVVKKADKQIEAPEAQAPTDGETELVISKKGAKAADTAKAATVAKKKTAGNKPDLKLVSE